MANADVTPNELLNFAPPIQDGTVVPLEAAQQAIAATHGLIDGYTRGRYRDQHGHYRPGIQAVVLTVAARLLANPGQVTTRVQAGTLTVSKGPGFQGFTLAEQLTLNRYRKRSV